MKYKKIFIGARKNEMKRNHARQVTFIHVLTWKNSYKGDVKEKQIMRLTVGRFFSLLNHCFSDQR